MISENVLDVSIDNRFEVEFGPIDYTINDLQINLDLLVHEPKRMAILLILTKNPKITFSNLQKILKTTSGNLTNHLKHLNSHYLVEITKTFVNTRTCTVVSITEIGLKRLKKYYTVIESTFQQFNI